MPIQEVLLPIASSQKEAPPETTQWSPANPYLFKSGRHQGKCAEVMMFSALGYWRLAYILKMMDQGIEKGGGRMNDAHRHLRWLMGRGENLNPHLQCRYCQKKVSIFSAIGDSRFGYSISAIYTACRECHRRLADEEIGHSVSFYPIKFSSILKFRARADQDLVAKLIRDTCCTRSRMTSERAFEFFLNQCRP